MTAYAVHAAPPAAAAPDGDDEEPPPFRETALPHAALDASWDALELPAATKRALLRTLGTSLALARAGVDPACVPGGRLAILHGPPGSGKSTLARAAAHRLAIEHGAAYAGGATLVEVQAAGLHSKWLGASPRGVARVFDRVAALATDDGCLTFVVIDEVESIAGTRGGAGDPGDAARATNALLTALDGLAARPGVAVLATTNLTAALDPAFVDRADVVLRLGAPGAAARRALLRASLAVLVRARLVAAPGAGEGAAVDAALAAAAGAGSGLSGRQLARLPLAALSEAGVGAGVATAPVGAYLAALRAALDAAVARPAALAAAPQEGEA